MVQLVKELARKDLNSKEVQLGMDLISVVLVQIDHLVSKVLNQKDLAFRVQLQTNQVDCRQWAF